MTPTHTDHTTKALLLAIALGLWVQIAGSWLRPVPVQAQDVPLTLSGIQIMLTEIESNVASLVRGTCPNKKLC